MEGLALAPPGRQERGSHSPHAVWLEGRILQIFVGNKVERRVKLECKFYEGKTILAFFILG